MINNSRSILFKLKSHTNLFSGYYKLANCTSHHTFARVLALKPQLASVDLKRLQSTDTNNEIGTKSESEISKRQAKIAEEKTKNEMKNALAQDKQLLLKVSPNFLEPYIKLMRLDRTAPIYLSYWPGAWAIIGAASYQGAAMPDFYLLGLFGLGAMTMRTSGCIINDIWDRNLDKLVERTKDRPLASGKIGLPSAFLLLGANLSASLAILLQLNLTTQILGACCLFPVAIYPAAKRFTNWPQAVLGVAFNWGALMGWSAVLCSTAAAQTGNIFSFLPALALYAGCINWTLFYDTIYAFQDKKYDENLGIKSTAIHLNKRKSLWLLGFSSLCTSNLALYGFLTNQEPIFYMTVGLSMLHFLKQIIMVDYKSPESCYKQFKSNNTIGALITFGLLASIFIK